MADIVGIRTEPKLEPGRTIVTALPPAKIDRQRRRGRAVQVD